MSFVPIRYGEFVRAVGARQYNSQKRFLRQMVGGIVSAESVTLLKVGEALREPCTLGVTESRLSRQLANERFSDLLVEEDYLRLVAPFLRDRRHPVPTIAVDFTDIQKRYARRMPHLAHVFDGSASDRKEVRTGPGYQIIEIEAVGRGGRRCPLSARLFSRVEPGFISEVRTVEKSIELVRPHVPDRALWAFDRGFDGRKWFEAFQRQALRFVVRLQVAERNARHLWVDGTPVRAGTLARTVETPHKFRARRFSPKAEKTWILSVGFVEDVRLQGYAASGRSSGEASDRSYSLVVVRGTGKEPILLLTSEKVRTALQAQRIADAYMDRWGVEEAHRFAKQAFSLENNLRVLSWTGLKRLVLLAMLAYGFLAVMVHRDQKAIRALAETFKHVGKLPEYLFYLLARNMADLLAGVLRSGP